MKNLFKNTLVVLALATTFVACKGSGSANSGDTAKADSSVKTTVDTTVKVDTAKKDSLVKADTTVTKKTAVKTVEKKDSTKKQ